MPAWALASAMWWATTSCRSRAIRIRSSATRRRASSSRVRSARSARRSIAASWARRLRTESPSAPGSSAQASTLIRSPIEPSGPKTSVVAVSSTAEATEARNEVVRSVRTARK